VDVLSVVLAPPVPAPVVVTPGPVEPPVGCFVDPGALQASSTKESVKNRKYRGI
jgi:hypothetical protein